MSDPFPSTVPEREEFILEQVKIGNFKAIWEPITYSTSGHSIKMYVMGDALKIFDVRVNVTATLEQKLADIFDASLMTPQVADLVYVSASRRADPAPMPISSTNVSMKKHSQKIDSMLTNQPESGITATVGKHWVLDKQLEMRPNVACNYGWHFTGPTFQGIKGYAVTSPINSYNSKKISVIQPNATAHNALHTDYSQICQLVSQTCWVDGVEKRFSDVLMDKELSVLVSHQGPLKAIRQPGVVEQKGLQVLFPVSISSNFPNPNKV